MGLFGSAKQTTTTTQKQTPTNPDWVTSGVQNTQSYLANLLGQDPRSFVASTNPLLQQAGTGAAGLTFDKGAYQSANGLFQGLMNTAAPQAKASGILGQIDQYLNPYLANVETNALAAFDKGAGEQMAEAKLAQANSDTFGGSGGVQYLSNLGSGLALNRGTLSGNIRHQGYDTAAGYANQQADRDTQASIANAQLRAQQLALQGQSGRDMVDTASRYYSDQQGILGAQSQIGAQLQAIDQARAGAPVNVGTQVTGAMSALPYGLFQGQQVDGTSKSKTAGGLLNDLASVAKIGASAATIFSDGRLKTDVETVRHDHAGRRWVRFRYLWDQPDVRHEGVIAQEVAKSDPHAVSRHESGYLMVNYGELH